MTIPDKGRINKLIERIHHLVEQLAEYERNLVIHRCIDQYHLIQKAEELRLMYEAFEMMRIDKNSIVQHYRQVYFRWRQDVRRMHAFATAIQRQNSISLRCKVAGHSCC